MVVPTPSSCRSPSLQPVHYLNSGIAVPIPPYGVVESYDEELEPEDTCARPLSLRNGNGIRKPELDGTPKNGVALNREGGHDLLTVAREFQERIERFLESEVHTKVLRDVQRQTRISLEVVEQALRSYQYEELSMSFNGGKDCLVMLILYLAGISRHYSKVQQQHRYAHNEIQSPQNNITCSPAIQTTIPPPRIPTSIPSVYVMSSHPFPEVDHFVSQCVHRYHLTVHRYPLPMKHAFETYLNQHPHVKAIFVGTRRTDPHGGKLTFFDRTDKGWPDFMRVHPVIDWHYQEIWAFLRYLEIPYCPLYDLGYTSLGGTTDTHPNPKLAVQKGERSVTGTGFKPAYELLADEEERLGRDR